MATAKAPIQQTEKQKMAQVDISKLSYMELKALAEEAQAKAEAKREEEIKILADAYAKKAAAAGFTPEEALEAFMPYLPQKKARAKKGSAVKVEKAYQKGVTYKNPKTDEQWEGGSKGRRPPWLRELISDDMAHADAVAAYAKIAKK